MPANFHGWRRFRPAWSRRVKNPVHPQRIRLLNRASAAPGPVVYWMSRDQRTADNWALLHARAQAKERKEPLAVVFCLADDFLSTPYRHYDFMLAGLSETETSLRNMGIPFFLRFGDPAVEIPRFLRKCGAGLLVTDFDPLRIKREWKNAASVAIRIATHEVDAHNVVPCWIASEKQEWGAYTLRPKIHRLLAEFLEPFPAMQPHPHAWPSTPPPVDWQSVRRRLKADRNVGPVAGLDAGPAAGRRRLRRFLAGGLARYDEARNDPVLDGQSGLSPYLHFGHISAQRAVLEVRDSAVDPAQKEAFIEELIVRRELADNFCFYRPDYDSFSGFPDWAKKTLGEHHGDLRPYSYAAGRLEAGETHDALWNAAQMEMVKTGKMHGYLRMYWAKKILEWTKSPEQAMEIAIRLNDRYELDGRDPNGYAGIAWSIGGVHDRAWGERPVFGKIRYMSEKGCRSKFDAEAYIRRIGEI
jgi:deoxyribodipyrimidine photo-lyase